ncbi:MAG: hypothetical protein OXH75_10315 [Acidobacteria bacterium]|nr:hypothetical protein [Acidobacteriota bacterium]
MTYQQVVSGRPDLVLRVEHVVLRSELDVLALRQRLAQVGLGFRGNGLAAYRGLYGDARRIAEALNENRAEYKRDLERLLVRLELLRAVVAGERGEWAVEQVTYDSGTVKWADDLELEASDVRLALREFLPRETMERLRDDWSNVDPETAAGVRRAAAALRNAAGSNEVGRNGIVAQVEELESRIGDAAEERDQRVFLTLRILNRSRVPNAIVRSGLLRVGGEDIRIELPRWSELEARATASEYGAGYDVGYTFSPIGVGAGVGNWINENAGIAPYGGLTLLWRSRRLNDMDERVRRAVRIAFADNEGFALAVQDASERTWTTGGELGSMRGEEYDQGLVAGLNRVMPSGGER